MDTQIEKFTVGHYYVDKATFFVSFEDVVVRKIYCRGYLYIRVNEDGTFGLDFRQGVGQIRRVDQFLVEAPEGTRKKVVEFAIEAVKAYIAKNPSYVHDTKILDMKNEIARIEGDIEKLQKEFVEKTNLLFQKRNELTELSKEKG